MLRLAIISVLGLLVSCVSYDRVITVDSLDGHDTPGCVRVEEPCLTLTFAFAKNITTLQHSSYVLNEGTHNLNESTEAFQSLTSISLMGQRANTTTVYCTNAGLAFIGVKNLHLSNITLYNCSGV